MRAFIFSSKIMRCTMYRAVWLRRLLIKCFLHEKYWNMNEWRVMRSRFNVHNYSLQCTLIPLCLYINNTVSVSCQLCMYNNIWIRRNVFELNLLIIMIMTDFGIIMMLLNSWYVCVRVHVSSLSSQIVLILKILFSFIS